MMSRRAGVTLIELVVVIAILGILAALSTVSFRAQRRTDGPTLAARIHAATREAVRSGRPVSFVVADGPSPYAVRALPDGRVLADAPLGVDVTTGRVVDASR